MQEGSMISAAEILEIEVAAFHAWPALHGEEVAGWRLRSAEGVTGRANSVWALCHDGTLDLDTSVREVERFYIQQGLAPRFQINAAVTPAGLDAWLDARGYRLVSPTFVQTAPLAGVVQHSPALRAVPHVEVEVVEEFDPAWFAFYRDAAAMDGKTARVREAILRRLPAPASFVLAKVEGKPAGVGVGVADSRWLGIFCMETLRTFRRRGAATAILRTLAIWGQMYSCETAYLQVNSGNTGARQLYARLGYATVYPYHYRVLDALNESRERDHRPVQGGG